MLTLVLSDEEITHAYARGNAHILHRPHINGKLNQRYVPSDLLSDRLRVPLLMRCDTMGLDVGRTAHSISISFGKMSILQSNMPICILTELRVLMARCRTSSTIIRYRLVLVHARISCVITHRALAHDYYIPTQDSIVRHFLDRCRLISVQQRYQSRCKYTKSTTYWHDIALMSWTINNRFQHARCQLYISCRSTRK